MDSYTKREIWKMTFNEAFKLYLKRKENLDAAKARGADPEVIAGLEEECTFIRAHMERNKSDPYGIR